MADSGSVASVTAIPLTVTLRYTLRQQIATTRYDIFLNGIQEGNKKPPEGGMVFATRGLLANGYNGAADDGFLSVEGHAVSGLALVRCCRAGLRGSCANLCRLSL